MFPVETISARMLDYYVDRRDSLIIDLREEKEYRKIHVKGAKNVSYKEIEEGYFFPENKILVLYCDRGGASLKAAKFLAGKGYRTRSVIGGFLAYRGRNLVISR